MLIRSVFDRTYLSRYLCRIGKKQKVMENFSRQRMNLFENKTRFTVRRNYWRKLPIAVVIFLILNTGFSVAETAEEWRNDKACGKRLADFQKDKDLSGCINSYSAKAGIDSKISACEKSEEGDVRITYNYNGSVVKEWTEMIYPFDASSLRLDEIDLNDINEKGYLLGINTSIGNGMAIEFWNVFLIDREKISRPLKLEDYGLMGFATRSKGNKSCMLFASKWLEGWEPKYQKGLYIVGQWYDLKDGHIFRADRPAVYRRYLSSLQRKRGEMASHPPFLWFKSEDAHPVIGPYPFRNLDER